MPVQRMCKDCGRSIIVWSSVQTRCAKCQKARSKAKPPKPLQRSTKPIKKIGKETLKYNAWRDKVAKPYLDKKYGIKCDNCGAYPHQKDDGEYTRHDVAHKKTRGARHDLKFDVKNVRYLCRICHGKETDGKL